MTAESVPVAVTVCVTLPRSTTAVRYRGSAFRWLRTKARIPAAAARARATQSSFFISLRPTAPPGGIFQGAPLERGGVRTDYTEKIERAPRGAPENETGPANQRLRSISLTNSLRGSAPRARSA